MTIEQEISDYIKSVALAEGAILTGFAHDQKSGTGDRFCLSI